MRYQCDECKDGIKHGPCIVDIPYHTDSMEQLTLCVLNGEIEEGRFKPMEDD